MTPAGIEPATSRFVAQYLNHCATAVPNKHTYKLVYTSQKGAISYSSNPAEFQTSTHRLQKYVYVDIPLSISISDEECKNHYGFIFFFKYIIFLNTCSHGTKGCTEFHKISLESVKKYWGGGIKHLKHISEARMSLRRCSRNSGLFDNSS